MPSISNKGLLMPESPIRKLVPYAEAAKKKGTKVYHLNIGQPDIKTPKIALDAVKNNRIEVLSYARSEGSEEYREKLSGYYRKNKIKVEASNIIATTGGSEALLFTIGSISDPGDEIIIPEPFYANYNGFSTASGVKVVPVISKIEHNFSLPKIEDEIKKLKELVLKHDLFLIADEVYREFAYDGNLHHSVMSESGLEQHAIMIDSVSKRYSMCGARIGCIVSKNSEFINTALKFAQARLSPPTYALIASEAALDTPDEYFKEVIDEYVERRNTLITELTKIEGVKVANPKGAFYCIVQLPVDDTDHFARWMLEEFHYQNETLMVAPASGFYSTKGEGKNQVRIAYVLEKQELIKCAKILKIALKTYKD
jgi:aspartate aminotransferase